MRDKLPNSCIRPPTCDFLASKIGNDHDHAENYQRDHHGLDRQNTIFDFQIRRPLSTQTLTQNLLTPEPILVFRFGRFVRGSRNDARIVSDTVNVFSALE